MVYAFIDSQNLNLGVRNDIRTKDGKHFRYKGWNLDFGKFFQFLKDELKVEKAFIFIGFVPENQELYDALSKIGYELVYKPILEITNKETSDIKVKGNIDAELVLHTMINYPKYDKAVIVSGDGDFHCLVEYLAKQGKLARLIIPNMWNYSSLLEEYKEYFLNVNDWKKILRYSPGRKTFVKKEINPENGPGVNKKGQQTEVKVEQADVRNDGTGPKYFGM